MRSHDCFLKAPRHALQAHPDRIGAEARSTDGFLACSMQAWMKSLTFRSDPSSGFLRLTLDINSVRAGQCHRRFTCRQRSTERTVLLRRRFAVSSLIFNNRHLFLCSHIEGKCTRRLCSCSSHFAAALGSSPCIPTLGNMRRPKPVSLFARTVL